MTGSLQTLAYWVCQRGQGRLRESTLPATLGEGESRIRALCTGVSPGTERLVGLGMVPPTVGRSMACRYMEGSFDLPVKYGYSYVGVGEAGHYRDRRVFVMHPHQDVAQVRDEHVAVLPDDIPDERATVIPNLETGLNAFWDANLGATERSVVVGAGPVGLLVAYVTKSHGMPTLVAEIDAARRARAADLPWVDQAVHPDELPRDHFDAAFHTSARPSGLQTSIDVVGFEGRVLEMSWFGRERVGLDLGGSFHHMRKQILSSQVSAVARPKRSSHDHGQRMDEVLRLLRNPELDRLLDAPIQFAEMPRFMRNLYAGTAKNSLPVIAYAN